MDDPEIVSAFRVVLAIAVFSYAAMLDWRTRKIENKYWIFLTVVGFVLIPVQVMIDRLPGWYIVTLAPVAAILGDIYVELREGTRLARVAPVLQYGFAVLSVVLFAFLWWDEPGFRDYLAVPLMMLLVVVLYMLDIVRGGADAKALIALSVLFPVRPVIDPLPLIFDSSAAVDTWLPFSFIVLFNASVLVVLVPIAMLVKNSISGDFKLPYALVGYMTEAKNLKGKHVWLMEHMTAQGHVMRTRPRRSENLEEEAKQLIDAGHARVWVTPKIPFILPLLASIVFTAVVGNLLVLLFPY